MTLKTAWLAAPLAAILLAASLAGASAGQQVVNDVTQLNPIVVERILAPTRLEDIVAAVGSHPGPISIGGARYSMGGQTATERSLHLDMRQFDKVVRFAPRDREITVQAGITWRKIQNLIDPHGLSLQVMQSYANFTVGGSLSVNAHGRYMGQGPLVSSVRSIRIVLADGSLVTASPALNRDIFYGAIGGYGGLGVIVEATLALTDNVRVERRTQVMPLAQYRDFFLRTIKTDPNVVFQNATLYPGTFDTVRAVSFLKTTKPLTEPLRLVPDDKNYWLEHRMLWLTSALPGGTALRQRVLDPLYYARPLVEWRNYEASYDARELEPASRSASTYVLQEYFVPPDKLEQFGQKMGAILRRHGVNAINVSIRYATKDPGTLLAWARDDVFALVLYYKQGTAQPDRASVAAWSRELIDAALALGGTYYLPYQIHATEAQFHAAYPNARQYFALKQRLDPANKFRNKLWDAYYREPTGSGADPGK